MGLDIELLGRPRVRVDDRPLDVDTRKAVAVLTLTAVDGPQERGAVAAMLWPESDAGRARGALRRTLSVLSRALDRRWLVAGRDTVRLEGAGIRCDVTEAERLADGPADGPARHERLRQLVDLHRGPFLAGFELRDSPGFDDWRVLQEEHLRRRRCAALDELSRAALAAGDLAGARADLERWLEVDPLNERVHVRLMQVEAWRGDRAAAVARYRACVTVLDRDLGVAPLARTNELYRAIVEDRLPPRRSSPPTPARVDPARPPSVRPAPRGPAASRSGASPWPLVDRDDELTALIRHSEAGVPLVTVTGEAGIGKTALVETAVERLATAGVRVATARCEAGEVGLAFGPVVDLLRSAIGDPPHDLVATLAATDRAEVARLVPDLLPDVDPSTLAAPLDSPGAQLRFFAAVWEVLETLLDGPRPGLLVIDELHAIDPASRDLLAFGLRRHRDRRLTVLGCVRHEDLDAATSAVLHEAGAREVPLPRVGLDGVRRLVAAAGLDDADDVARRVHDESEGLPLLVVEYLQLLADRTEDGRDEAHDDGWSLPRGATELARSRLQRLSATARQIASAGAVIGRSFDLTTVQRASGRTDEEIVDGLEELVARGLVRELPGEPGTARYDFVHDKLRVAIYEETSRARRRLLHGRVAAALASDRHRRALAALIGEHARLGGDDEDAARWFELAGDHHRALFANADAVEYYERALAAGHADTSELRAKLGAVRILTGDYVRAVDDLEVAAATAPDEDRLARVEHQLGGLHLRRGELDIAEAHLLAARARAGDGHPLAARLVCDLGLVALRRGDLTTATDRAGEALHVVAGDADREARAQAHNLAGIVARHRGDLHEARDQLRRSVVLAEELDDPAAHVAALNNLALAAADAGDHDGAVALLEQAIVLGRSRGDRHREAALRGNLADALHHAGREEEAMEALKEAVAIFADVGVEHDRPEIWQLVEW